MAVDLVVTYPGRVDAADAEYPFGKPRNRVSPGDGTPFDEALYRDYVGMMGAAMRQSGITAATNVPEKVGTSQMLQGIARHIAGGSSFYEDSGVADAYVIDVPGTLPNVFESSSILFDGMRVRWLAANANTGASTLDVEFQGVSISSPQSLTLEGGTALSGGEINTVVENEARFDLGNSRWVLIRAFGIGGSESIFATQLLHITHELTSGTDGPAISAGTFTTRPLNTVRTNEISGASLSSNEITLTAGDYYIEANSTLSSVTDGVKSKLRNITDVSDILIGSTGYATGGTTALNVMSFISGRFTLAATKNVAIQNWAFDAGIFGNAATAGVSEVYADIKIWKVG